MKISIVTISFNQVKYIEETIKSIINQNYDDLEYIVVDAGSTDGSREIIEKYRNRISKIIYESDKGPADGLNKGFRNASGKILGFVNSDDVLFPYTLKKIDSAFINNPDVEVIYGDGIIIDENGNRIRRLFTDNFNLYQYLYGSVTFIQPSVFFKKEAFWDAGGFNIANKTCWDGELMLDFCIKEKRFLRIKGNLSGFRKHNKSFGSSKPGSKYRNDLEKTRERIFNKVKKRGIKWYDTIFFVFYRILKWLKNPTSFFYNIVRKISLNNFK